MGLLTVTPSQTLKDVRSIRKCPHSQGPKLQLVLNKIDEQEHAHAHTHAHISWEQLSVELFDSTAGQSVLSERPISWIPGAAHRSWPTLTLPPLTLTSLPSTPLHSLFSTETKPGQVNRLF